MTKYNRKTPQIRRKKNGEWFVPKRDKKVIYQTFHHYRAEMAKQFNDENELNFQAMQKVKMAFFKYYKTMVRREMCSFCDMTWFYRRVDKDAVTCKDSGPVGTVCWKALGSSLPDILDCCGVPATETLRALGISDLQDQDIS